MRGSDKHIGFGEPRVINWLYDSIYCICLNTHMVYVYIYIYIHTPYTLQACISPPLFGTLFLSLKTTQVCIDFFSFKLGLSVNSRQIVCGFGDIFCGKTNELVGSFHFWLKEGSRFLKLRRFFSEFLGFRILLFLF